MRRGGPGAALGFATALLGRLMAAGGHVVWIGPRDELFAPGLAELGLAPERLIVVRARARAARLWALEEALRSPGLAAALAEVDRLSPDREPAAAARRRGQGVSALLLRPPGAGATPSAAATRWRIEAAPGQATPSAAPLGAGGAGVRSARRTGGSACCAAAAAAPAAGRSPGGRRAGMRSRILSLWLPNLATDRLLRHARRGADGTDAAGSALDPKRPLATFVNQKSALRLEAVCARPPKPGSRPA